MLYSRVEYKGERRERDRKDLDEDVVDCQSFGICTHAHIHTHAYSCILLLLTVALPSLQDTDGGTDRPMEEQTETDGGTDRDR